MYLDEQGAGLGKKLYTLMGGGSAIDSVIFRLVLLIRPSY